ncbi:ABC transporter ATP-binding protein [Kiloniella sp. b19]|uniref:ABC transporter ATP-binding protein n=1 Tax=Kiloniella sp. GXU_MW_B19 TaxID=3141326 RepID=UPI0031D3405E
MNRIAEKGKAAVAGLELVDVVKTYQQGKRTLHVLDKVNLSLESGQAVALIGPSGAGKSTLLQIAGLLEQPDAGEILVKGVAVSGKGDAHRTALRRTGIGFVYQYHHLLPEFSARENVILPQMINGKSRKVAGERADYLLDLVGLAERGSHRPAELSGGEQQRTAIARALANDPAVLLADEPTGNLDPETSERVFDLLMKLVRTEGLSAFIATHDHTLARRMDRVLHFEGGKVVEG